jgi:hypothetical protein
MTFSIMDLRLRFGVGEHTILHWIHSGQLRAQNVSRNPNTRPKWRITEEALQAFELTRASAPPASSSRRRKQSPAVLDLIK